MDALDNPACCICNWLFQRLPLYGHACSPVRCSCVHTNGTGWIYSGILTVGLLHAQNPTIHTVAAQLLSVLACTFSCLMLWSLTFCRRPRLYQQNMLLGFLYILIHSLKIHMRFYTDFRLTQLYQKLHIYMQN